MSKALDMSEEFFWRVAMPSLKESFPNHWDRIGAGLVGNGSECLGFDDDLSSDHDWGIEFFMWLTQEDFAEIGEQVIEWKRALFAAHPEEPFRVISDYGVRSTVMTPQTFFISLIGSPGAPEKILDWRRVPEANFVMVTNGRIFTDPIGEFTAIREEILKYYPRDLWLKKIAARCLAVAQTGQYNYLRTAQRGDRVTCEVILSKFVEDVISMVFLLNKRFMPYYKWALRAMRDLPLLASEIAPKLEKLYSGEMVEGEIPAGNVVVHEIEPVDRSRAIVIEEICALIADELRRQGLSDSSSTFLVQHGEEVQSRIEDAKLASLPTQYE